MRTFPLLLRTACLGGLLMLAACSPKFDWREVRGAGAPFVVTLPAKPASLTRHVDLDGLPISMTMTAAEVDDVTFAVGAAELPDPAQSGKALNAMKSALVRNIGGTVRHEKASAPGIEPAMIELEASGSSKLLLARFVARDKYIYQVVVVGNEKAVSREAADTFFTSFKPN